ncbi:hypothetical protein KC867_01270 [Candidatus Saccharibacteria bacterium]|nr:hypothetical protein [Candidatus Saccharibacteria bacterium]
MDKRQLDAEQQDKQTLASRLLGSRIVKSMISGLVITLISWLMIGFNLSTSSAIRMNDNINRYFDTCIGNVITESSPKITTERRGFPLAYSLKDSVPICENLVEQKRVASTYFEAGAFFANGLFWTCISFMILRTYIRRKHIKIKRLA